MSTSEESTRQAFANENPRRLHSIDSIANVVMKTAGVRVDKQLECYSNSDNSAVFSSGIQSQLSVASGMGFTVVTAWPFEVDDLKGPYSIVLFLPILAACTLQKSSQLLAKLL